MGKRVIAAKPSNGAVDASWPANRLGRNSAATGRSAMFGLAYCLTKQNISRRHHFVNTQVWPSQIAQLQQSSCPACSRASWHQRPHCWVLLQLLVFPYVIFTLRKLGHTSTGVGQGCPYLSSILADHWPSKQLKSFPSSCCVVQVWPPE